MSYPDLDDLRTWLRVTDTWDSDTQAQAQQVLDLAIGRVEDEVGQSLPQATETVTLDGTGTKQLVLPRWPVTAVSSVTVDGDTLDFDDDWRWSRTGVLWRIDDWWPEENEPRHIDVEFTAGWNPVPGDVRAVILRMAGSAWHRPIPGDQSEAGLTQETVGSWSRSWARPRDLIAMLSFSPDEYRILSRYRSR